MCLTFPARVVALDGSGAVVEIDGRHRRASVLLVPDIGVGEWVAVAAGTIVDRLDGREAAELGALLRVATQPAPKAAPSEPYEGDRHDDTA